LNAAKQRAMAFRSEMNGRGWPQPAFALSGNGYHLMYRSGFAEPERFLPYYKRLYAELVKKYSDDAIKLDAAVKNPGRLTRLYGSINRKGKSTPELQQRTSAIWMPESYDKISYDAMWNTVLDYGADKTPEKTTVSGHRYTGSTGSGDYKTLDTVGWFSSLGLYIEHIQDNIHAVHCPWAGEHTTDSTSGDCIVYSDDPGFHCKHGHCSGRTLWDVVSYLDGADSFCSRQFKRAR